MKITEINEPEKKECVSSVFTVFFEDPFWVGILEENYDGEKYMGKHIFGAEPSNSDLLQFCAHGFEKIKKIKVSEADVETKKVNYKKSIYKAKKTQEKVGVGTKSQKLFKVAFEETMKIKEKEKKIEELLDKEEKYQKKLKKKLEKKKGH